MCQSVIKLNGALWKYKSMFDKPTHAILTSTSIILKQIYITFTEYDISYGKVLSYIYIYIYIYIS